MNVIKAIRLPNLLIIALTQVCIKYVLINSHFGLEDSSLSPSGNFALLVCATLSLTAFGYIINDYFDFELDRYSTRKVKSGMSKQSLFMASICSVVIGFILSLILAVSAGLLHLLWIYPVAAYILYLYSKTLKAQGLIGNMIIALFTAGVIYIVVLAEQHVSLDADESIQSIIYSFMIFSFMINLYREIIKDIEDIKEDKAYGLKTLPIKIGPVKAGLTAFFFGLVILCILIFFGLTLANSTIQKTYVIGLLVLPWLLVLYLNHYAVRSKDYHRISQLTKGIMLSGLAYLFLV